MTMDKAEARRRADEAIARVEAAARRKWIIEARSTVCRLALTNKTFSSDDIWESGLSRPREPRAMGPIIIWARKVKIIEFTGQMERSARPERHTGYLPVYESLIYRGAL